MSEFAFKVVDDLLLAVHSTRPPLNHEWEAYVQEHQRLAREGRKVSILVFTEGGAPNSAQRAALKAAVPGDLPTAIVTSSVAVRGVVTAFNWLGWSSMRAFAPFEVDVALRYLNASEKRDVVRDELYHLQAQTRAA